MSRTIDSEWDYKEFCREYYQTLKNWKEGDDEKDLDEHMLQIKAYLLAKSLGRGEND
jgi:hypothetical protein